MQHQDRKQAMVVNMKFPAWHQRPEKFDPDTHREGVLDEAAFLRVADQFISLANQRNKKIEAAVQMVMLFGRRAMLHMLVRMFKS